LLRHFYHHGEPYWCSSDETNIQIICFFCVS
jgi:hypothetical protein